MKMPKPLSIAILLSSLPDDFFMLDVTITHQKEESTLQSVIEHIQVESTALNNQNKVELTHNEFFSQTQIEDLKRRSANSQNMGGSTHKSENFGHKCEYNGTTVKILVTKLQCKEPRSYQAHCLRRQDEYSGHKETAL